MDVDLRTLLSTLDPKACDDLRRVLIRDQTDRDAISSRLMRYRDQNGQDWADIIDFLTMWPDARRRYAGELIGPQRSMSASSLGNQFLGAKALVLGKANVGLTTD